MFGRTEKRTIAVEGMTCGHCEQRVEKVVTVTTSQDRKSTRLNSVTDQSRMPSSA